MEQNDVPNMFRWMGKWSNKLVHKSYWSFCPYYNLLNKLLFSTEIFVHNKVCNFAIL